MKESKDSLMPIGRFSEATRLSVKALRLYDEIGLLDPAHVDPQNGYRYYRSDQVARAGAIRLLRGVDVPLADIRMILDSAPQRRGEILARHRERLSQKLEEHQRMLDSFVDIIEGRKQIMAYDITQETSEETPVASVTKHTNLKDVGENIGAGFGEIMGRLIPQGKQPTGAPFVIYHDVIDEETSGSIEMCAPVVPEAADKILASQRVATTMHQGPYSAIAPAYGALSDWMSAEGYEPAGPPREIYLNDPRETEESELLTKVEWPIRAS